MGRINFIVFVAALIVSFMIMANGYVLWQYWEWFVVSSFGVNQISMPAAIGVSTLLSYVSGQYTKHENAKKGEIDRIFLSYLLARPVLALAIGYVVSRFV